MSQSVVEFVSVTPADDEDQYGLRVTRIIHKRGERDRSLITHALNPVKMSMEAIGAAGFFCREDDTNHLGGTVRFGTLASQGSL